MMRGKTGIALPMLAMVAATFIAFGAYGCRTASKTGAEPAIESTSAQTAEASGVELWAANCGRCHNLRDPASYNSAQWDVAVHHMRFRAQLTGQQEKAIKDYLASK